MSRTSEGSNHGIPNPPDVELWRHWGDGYAGRMVGARIQGWSSAVLDYVDVAVDANGVVQTAGGGGGGGAVTQGTTPWVVDGSGVTQPVSAAALPLPTGAAKDSTLTDGSQRVGGTVAVSGPLTDTQLRASAVPVSLATLPAITFASPQHVVVDTAPSTAVTNAGTFPVQATLAAETTKVIGTVNQGTTPWAVDGSAVTQPVSASALPLPAGASTDASTKAAVTAIREHAFSAWLAHEEGLFA